MYRCVHLCSPGGLQLFMTILLTPLLTGGGQKKWQHHNSEDAWEMQINRSNCQSVLCPIISSTDARHHTSHTSKCAQHTHMHWYYFRYGRDAIVFCFSFLCSNIWGWVAHIFMNMHANNACVLHRCWWEHICRVIFGHTMMLLL